MANLVTNKLKFRVLSGSVNLGSAVQKLMLLKSGTPNADDNFVADITPGTNELSVAGYARVTLTTKSVTEDDTNDFAYMDADDVAFAALTAGQTITWAYLLEFVTNDADSFLEAAYDVTDTPTNGGVITIVWNTPANGGVLKAA
jgi:hypothetical protein